MNPQGNLLLVGAADDTVRKAKKLGLTVLLLQHPSKLTAEQETLADVMRVVDYTDWEQAEPVVRELARDPGFRVALSLTEPGLEPAGRVNDMFGLGGTSLAVAHRIRDKWEMRRHLGEQGVRTVAAQRVTDRASLEAFLAEHGPFIVKPVDGTASFGIFLVRQAGDVDRVWAQVRDLQGRRTDRGSTLFFIDDFLMEQYVDGPEFSVESFSFAGRHVIVAVTEKFVAPGFAELGHVVPARIPRRQWDDISEYVVQFLDAIGIRDGVCHTELRVGPDGPVVIEGHNRIGGDAIPDLVRGVYGLDLSTYALAWPFGLVEELPEAPQPRGAGSSRFLISEPGRVESVEGVEAAAALPDVLEVRVTAHPGDAVRELHDNWDRLGLVAVHAPDPDAAIRRGAEVLRETVRVLVTGPDGVTRPAQVAAVEPLGVPA